MALEESVDGLEKFESNGITAYLEKSLREYIEGQGTINIDFVKQPSGSGGYMVTLDSSGNGGKNSFCC